MPRRQIPISAKIRKSGGNTVRRSQIGSIQSNQSISKISNKSPLPKTSANTKYKYKISNPINHKYKITSHKMPLQIRQITNLQPLKIIRYGWLDLDKLVDGWMSGGMVRWIRQKTLRRPDDLDTWMSDADDPDLDPDLTNNSIRIQ